MRMLYDYVLVKEVKKTSVVAVPGRVSDYPAIGEVVAVGQGDAYGYPIREKTTVKKGDIVYFVRDRAVKVEGLKLKDHYILREREVYGIVDKDEMK